MTATADYRRKDAAHYLHPFTDTLQLGADARIFCRGEGVYVWDSDGNKLLDGMSGLWCVNIGYGRREIIDAVHAQLLELPYYNSFFQSATPAAVDLAAELSRLAPPGFNRVFYAGSGSEANDTVVRLIRRYWQLQGEPQRQIIISRRNAYHGSTIAAASLGGMRFMHEQLGALIPGVAHIRQPYWFGEGRELSEKEFGERAAAALEEKIEELGVHRVAAFIGEPVQGAGGVIIPPDNYWPAIQDICERRQIPIVADEVICGFGRLGEWFGGQRFGIKPKLMPIAKGLTSGYLPLGGVMVHDDIAEVLIKKGGEFAHGFTYGGHPVCAAAALANIAVLQKEKIIETVAADTAPYFQQQWARLGRHPLVGEARCIGMMAAMELVRDKDSGERFECSPAAGVRCRQFSIEHGLIMRAVGDIMIVAPPLIITRGQIDELVDRAWRALESLQKALRR